MEASTNTGSSQNRRSIRSILIHRPMQREFTLITVIILMFSMVLVAFLIRHTLNETISNNVSSFGKIGAYNVLSDVSFDLTVRVILVMFITIITIALFGVFFLHRVAGPVYRFHQLFLKINQDEIPQDVHLRRKDFFKELAIELNLLFKLLRKRKTAIQQINGIVTQVSGQEAPEEIRKKLEEIRQILKGSKDSS
ncbi:MAG: hypothetical protein HY582_04315 [Candidatus Omnitrophica bacterium]|nr:hypothetical protein [Candidatus Omnitrophota bacterium]